MDSRGLAAMKYGSLSGETGHVVVNWSVDNIGSAAQFAMEWREVGGPIVKPPRKRGFGSKLIRMGLVGMGGVDIRYAPTGLEAELRAPLAQIQLS
jgi:two-component sensor histidine kinase